MRFPSIKQLYTQVSPLKPISSKEITKVWQTSSTIFLNSSKETKKMSKFKSQSGARSRTMPLSTLGQRGSPTSGLLSVDFEIKGKVQGVHFRKYTQIKASSLNLRGWCKNTNYGTVIGRMEGDRLKIDMMKDWLKRIGSPKSRIDAADFKKGKPITEYTYEEFQIIK